MTEKTKTETAIEYIAKHGSARTPDIASLLKIPDKNVQPLLQKALETGYLISCTVQVNTSNGIKRMKEYRLSATVSESKIHWREFSLARRKEDVPRLTPLKTATPKPEAPVERLPTTTLVAPSVRIPEPGKKSLFLLGSDGCLRIEAAGLTFELTRDETHNLGMFLHGSSDFWRHTKGESHVHA